MFFVEPFGLTENETCVVKIILSKILEKWTCLGLRTAVCLVCSEHCFQSVELTTLSSKKYLFETWLEM